MKPSTRCASRCRIRPTGIQAQRTFSRDVTPGMTKAAPTMVSAKVLSAPAASFSRSFARFALSLRGDASGSTSPTLSPELIVLRESLRRQTPRLGPVAEPVLELITAECACAVGRLLTGEAIGKREHLGVGDAAVTVALQAHALAADHFRQLLDGKKQELAVLADDRDVVAGGLDRDREPRLAVDAHDIAAFAGVGDRVVGRDDEAAPFRAREQQLHAGPVGDGRDDVGAVVEIDHEADRIAEAAPAGQLRGLDREHFAVRSDDEELCGRLGEERDLEPVVALELDAGKIGDVALQGADPALLRHDDGDRLALDHRLGEIDLGGVRRILEGGAAAPERRVRPEGLLHLADLPGDGLPLRGRRGEELLDLLLLLRQLLELALQLHLLELAQAAQPRVEDGVRLHLGEAEDAHQLLLRLVLLADDLDDPVEVEIDDQEAAQDLEALVDRGEAVARAPDQHLAAMVEPFAKAFGES